MILINLVHHNKTPFCLFLYAIDVPFVGNASEGKGGITIKKTTFNCFHMNISLIFGLKSRIPEEKAES